nr:MAG TPA: hypothetical protein [Caudoviricetes sp.]
METPAMKTGCLIQSLTVGKGQPKQYVSND